MNTRSGLAWLWTVALGAQACAGDDTSGDGGSGSGSGSGGASDTMTPADDGVDDGVDDDGTTAGPGDTTAGPPDGTADDTAGDSGSTTDPGGSTSGGIEVDCSMIPAGPFTPTPQFMPAAFMGSEDLAFDGMGNLAGKSGNAIRLVDAAGAEVALYTDMGPAYGVRFRGNGDLLVAHFMAGNIVQIEPDGTRSNFATGYQGINGLYPDLEDRVWLTDFSVVGRINADGSYQDIVTGSAASTSNGIVYDPDRGFAFFTNYSQGRIRKVAIDAAGEPGAVTDVAMINGASLDGLTLDACGNLYSVDQANSRIYRVMLDETAEALSAPENLLDAIIQNVANTQFGRGEGFDALSLYASGTPGIVYRIEVGVPGAEIPLP